MFSNIRGDLFGGITAGIVALPLALAFGVQSGLGATAGLYGAIALGVFAAIFGGTATQISGPTGPITVITSTLVASFIAVRGSVEEALPAIFLCFFLAGMIQVVLGLLKWGRFIEYIPYPVVSGFMTGIGVIIILLQIFPMLGHDTPKNTIEIITDIGVPLQNISWDTVFLSAVTIALAYLFPLLTKAVPATLAALLIGSLIPLFLPLDVALVGDIPSGLPTLQWSIFTGLDAEDFKLIALPALTIAALGAIDTLLTSVVADNLTRTKHNSNQELSGQGIGNMVAALIGGLPGAGATMRTVVNIGSGGKTKLSGVIHGLLLLGVLLGASKYASQIPLAVLAGILTTVGIGIVDRRGIKHIRKVQQSDAIIMIVVMLVTVFIDLLQAVAIGLIIASFLFMKRMSDLSQQRSSMASGELPDNSLKGTQLTITTENKGKYYIKYIDGPLFFGNSMYFQGLGKRIPPDAKALLIRMENVPYIDQSGLYALEEAFRDVESRKVEVFLCGLREQPEFMMRKINLIPNLIEERCLVASVEEFLEKLPERLKP